ncbi:MAG TPA: hypothetical protein VF190_16100, partial [Rhodothermales bacterium]
MFARKSTRIIGAFALLGVSLLWACAERSPNAIADGETVHYQTGVSEHEDGSGRFYMGREISQITGHGAAEWLERPTR